MSAIDIFHSARPKRGKYINEGRHEIMLLDGSAAMRFRWRGGLLPGGDQLFRFQTQTEVFGFLDTKSVEGMAKWGRKDPPYLGMLPSLGIAAWQAATTKTEGVQAFAVFYRNPEGHLGSFFALGRPEIVDQIAACVPREKISDDREKPEEP